MAFRQARQSALKEDDYPLTQSVLDKVSPVVASAKARASELGLELKQRAQDNARAADRYVHENPWGFIAAGLATGLLASWYLSSRRSR